MKFQSVHSTRRVAYEMVRGLSEPLRQVVAYLDLLKRRQNTACGCDVDEFIDESITRIEGARGLVDDVSLLLRAIEQRPVPKSVAAEAAVLYAMRNLKGTIDTTGARIEIGTMPRMRADLSVLARIFEELIRAAIKSTGENGKPQLQIDGTYVDAAWTFSVIHTGSVFHRTLGADLIFANQLVKSQDGRLWVEFRSSESFAICFTIPSGAD